MWQEGTIGIPVKKEAERNIAITGKYQKKY